LSRIGRNKKMQLTTIYSK